MLRLCCVIAALAATLTASQLEPGAQKTMPVGESKTPAIVNLNTATRADLEELPGIGAKAAARIIEYREKNGQFKKIEEIMNVQGIGEKAFLKLRPQLTVTGKTAAAAPQK
jgi:competence protein ComEA